MSSPPIFDAFFWIEPVKGSSKSSNTTRVLWNYPDDVSNVVDEFKDIPEFCFPDLARVTLEKAQNTRTEHYTFTLTDASGQRVYGICMRTLFRGMTRRYDVKRRVRHCLCVITRYPFFKFFKSVLMELHAVAMLEERPGCCRQFIDMVYRLADVASGNEQQLKIPAGTISAMYYEYELLRPKIVAGAGMGSKEVPVLPLFDTLGTERFFKLLSAVLCEKRIVFIAEEAETLSTTVLAAANILHPFKWHHVFIPLLPGRLLGLLQNQAPYMIGVRKYLLAELRRDSLDGTVIVDCDSGEVRLQGQVYVRDLIGDAATASKRAAESIDQMKAKMSAMFMGKSSDSQQDIGPKDLMVVMLSDLNKTVTSTKPSSYTISTLLGGGLNRSVEEAKMQWALDAEKALRDCMTVFFVYFFADLEEYMSSAAATGGVSAGFGTLVKGADGANNRRMTGMGSDGASHGGSSGDLRFSSEDARSHFDLKGYLSKRTQMGDSRQLVVFLQDFVHSQIFERFCAELIAKKQAQTARAAEQNRHKSLAAGTASALSSAGAGRRGTSLPTTLTSSGSAAAEGDDGTEEDLFEQAVREWNQRAVALTIANVKLCVSAVSPSGPAGKEMNSNFHALAVNLTSSSTPLAPCEQEIDTDAQYYPSYIGTTNQSCADSAANRETAKRLSTADAMLRRVISDAGEGDEFLSIMRTVHFRLQGCLAAGSRGSAGISGIRALLLCRSLLIEGPECVLTYCVDFIPMLRAILRLSQSLTSSGAQGKKTSKQQQALDYMSLGAFVDPTQHTKILLDLILDHKKLMVQRKVCVLLKRNAFPFLTEVHPSSGEMRTAQYDRTEMMFSAPYSSSKLFPKFDTLHQSLNLMGLRPVADGVLKLTPPELAVGAVEDRQNGGNEDDDAPSPHTRDPVSSSHGRSAPAPAPAPAAPSALAAYANPKQAQQQQRGSHSPTGKAASGGVKERFIYGDEDDAGTSSAPAAPAASSGNVSRPFSSGGPPKPTRPDSTGNRSTSPFKVDKPAQAQTAPAPAPAAVSGKISPFAQTGANAAAAANPANRRQSTAGTKVIPPPELRAVAPPVDLLNMDLTAPASDPFGGSDPFATDPFAPSFAPTTAPSSDPFASFAPTTSPFTATPASTSFTPSTKADDGFAPSTAWDAPAPAAAPFATSSPFDSFAPTTSATAAFAPTVSSDPFAPTAASGFPRPTSQNNFGDGFAPTVPGGAAGVMLPPPPVATSQPGSFYHARPPAGSAAAPDPFDFLNPIKK